jgi:hypothetical protein
MSPIPGAEDKDDNEEGCRQERRPRRSRIRLNDASMAACKIISSRSIIDRSTPERNLNARSGNGK